MESVKYIKAIQLIDVAMGTIKSADNSEGSSVEG